VNDFVTPLNFFPVYTLFIPTIVGKNSRIPGIQQPKHSPRPMSRQQAAYMKWSEKLPHPVTGTGGGSHQL
jgi:hypothetical protein